MLGSEPSRPGSALCLQPVPLASQSQVTGFPGDSVVKNLSAVQKPQETWVRSLGLEDPLDRAVQWATVHRVTKELDTT